MTVSAPPGPSLGTPGSPPPRPESGAETTWLLCLGAYLNARFRNGVIEELVRHEERSVAPSTGVDVVPVLLHALRARRLECRAGAAVALLWLLFWLADLYGADFLWSDRWSLAEAYSGRLPDGFQQADGYYLGYLGYLGYGAYTQRTFFLPTDLIGSVVRWPGSGMWALNYALVCLVLWVLRNGAASGAGAYSYAGLRRRSWLTNVIALGCGYLLLASYWAAALAAFWNSTTNWMALVFPLLLTVPVWRLRGEIEAVLRGELGRGGFRARPRPEVPDTPRLRRIIAAIDREQYSRLVLYEPARPFTGFGTAERPWSLTMDLNRRADDAAEDDTEPAADGEANAGPGHDAAGGAAELTPDGVLERVTARLADLRRVPGACVSRDRLLALEIDQLVYLPAGPRRDSAVRARDAVARHLSESVGEGAEARRHFLRVRVNAWEHHLVVSVLVRVHTQGEMLVLEVMPYVLPPLAEHFRIAAAAADRVGDAPAPALDAARALPAGPAAAVACLLTLAGSALTVVRTWLARPHRARPEPASRSVRELAGEPRLLPFQRMDASRYVKTIHERISTGALEALKAVGHDTGELEQQIVQVSNGGVFIGKMSGGAVASGRGALAASAERLLQVIKGDN